MLSRTSQVSRGKCCNIADPLCVVDSRAPPGPHPRLAHILLLLFSSLSKVPGRRGQGVGVVKG